MGDSPTYHWNFPYGLSTYLNGICYMRSAVRPAEIVDGTTKTFLVGEKYLKQKDYETGEDEGDDMSRYSGDDLDVTRWASKTAGPWANGPTPDTDSSVSAHAFGSAHVDGLNFAMCDGSVQWVGYDIDLETYMLQGSRDDSQMNELPPPNYVPPQ